jgi:hypothetical protein
MRLQVLLLGLALALSACATDGGGSRSAAATEKAADDTARDVMAAAAQAVDGSELEAQARWRVCSGGIGHQYQGGGRFLVPGDDTAQQLEAIRAALADAGFAEVSEVNGQVGVERDSVTVVVQPPIAPREWRVSFRSECDTYSGDDKARVESQDLRDLEGLAPAQDG